MASIGFEREVMKGFFVAADYVHQHVDDLDRTVDLNAPVAVRSHRARPGALDGGRRRDAADRAGQWRRPANQRDHESRRRRLRRPADFVHLSRHRPAASRSLSYTLSKATNTTEPDGNGIGPNDANISRAGRAGARTEPARSAASRGDHVQLRLAAQHHCRHRDAARVGTSVQRYDRHRQQRRRRQQRSSRDQRRGGREVVVPRNGTAGRVAVRRRPAAGCHDHLLRFGWTFNLFNHANVLGRERDLRRHRHAPGDVRPGQRRPGATSTRRGWSSSRSDISSEPFQPREVAAAPGAPILAGESACPPGLVLDSLGETDNADAMAAQTDLEGLSQDQPGEHPHPGVPGDRFRRDASASTSCTASVRRASSRNAGARTASARCPSPKSSRATSSRRAAMS